MNWQQVIIIVIGTLFLGGIAAMWYFGKDYLKYHNIFSPILKAFVGAVKALSGAMPNNTTLTIIAFVMDAALQGASRAEELWLNGQLDKDQRNMYAKDYIAETLLDANIELNENVSAMVDGFIAVACAVFPHGQEPSEDEEDEDEEFEEEETEENTETPKISEEIESDTKEEA